MIEVNLLRDNDRSWAELCRKGGKMFYLVNNHSYRMLCVEEESFNDGPIVRVVRIRSVADRLLGPLPVLGSK